MILADYHVHTTFCDGKNTAREVVESAIKLGLKELGFSVHSYTDFDLTYCVREDRIEEYQAQINALKAEFRDKIKILCGVEQDYYSTASTKGYDYIIGSMHYLKVGEKHYPIDEEKSVILECVNKEFNGDIYAFLECYFDNMSCIVEKTNANIIGHIDIVEKFNSDGKLFDRKNLRYVASYEKAVDKLLKAGVPFEINTGAISRGYTDNPYPSQTVLEYILKNGGKVILSSDSHSKNTLLFNFEKEYEKLVKMGYGDRIVTL